MYFERRLISLGLVFLVHAMDPAGVFHRVQNASLEFGKRSERSCADTRLGRAAPSDQSSPAVHRLESYCNILL